MKYLLIGYYLGSLIISEHPDKEACYGRRDVLIENKAVVKCVEAPGANYTNTTTWTYPTIKNCSGNVAGVPCN